MEHDQFGAAADAEIALLHERARAFWRNCEDARLAAPEYYARQEAALREMLPLIAPRNAALDIGCGDGYFTRVVREYIPVVTGIDLSPRLIAQARAAGQGVDGLQFEVADVQTLEHTFVDLVLCKGVISGLVDPAVFVHVVEKLAATARDGAVITKDTLSYDAAVHNFGERYVAVYRTREDYLDAFSRHGLTVAREIVLHDAHPSTRNSMFLFRRT